MSDVFFLVLRRLRAPLILLICIYALATLGMTLIPGQDDQGQVFYLSPFQAFYFVSFMGTTIGFGEIPYPFTDGQRAWVLLCIYTSVVAWLYAIGTVLRLLQDATFLAAVSQHVFKRNIRRIDQAFYIVCGYGETGGLIAQGLSELSLPTVIVDNNEQRTRSLELESLRIAPIVLNADITEPQNLIDAGINNPLCAGVIAVTESDHTNLKIAVAAKLVNADVTVICRSEIEDEAKNMASFGTDFIINPYLTFGRRLHLLCDNPQLHRVHNWFINQHSAEHIDERVSLQGLPKGKWIICGYGRFGKAVHQYIQGDDFEVIIVDQDPIKTFAPEDAIVGRGTEAETLIEAGIEDAAVVVAASDDDANNLSVLITARQLNESIFTIGRVSREADHTLFVRAKCDYIMRRSQVVANEALTVISRPLVTRFLQYSNCLTQDDTNLLIDRICALSPHADPVTWRLQISQQHSPALFKTIKDSKPVTIRQICEHSDFPKARAIPLLLLREGMSHILPEQTTELRPGDELLMCASREHTLLAQRLSHDIELIDTVINNNPHRIPLLRWLRRRAVL